MVGGRAGEGQADAHRGVGVGEHDTELGSLPGYGGRAAVGGRRGVGGSSRHAFRPPLGRRPRKATAKHLWVEGRK